MNEQVANQIVIPVLLAFFGAVGATLLGVVGFFLVRLVNKVDTLDKLCAEMSSKIGLIFMKIDPIDKLEKDIDAFHIWKRTKFPEEKTQ